MKILIDTNDYKEAEINIWTPEELLLLQSRLIL